MSSTLHSTDSKDQFLRSSFIYLPKGSSIWSKPYQELSKLKDSCLKELLSFFPKRLFLLSFIFPTFALQSRSYSSFLRLGLQPCLDCWVFLLFFYWILVRPQPHHPYQYRAEEDLFLQLLPLLLTTLIWQALPSFHLFLLALILPF